MGARGQGDGSRDRGAPRLDMEPEPGVLDELKWNGDVFIKGFWFAATWHAAFMIILTCFCTFLCSKGILDFSFDTSMGIVAVGTVFPLVFSVQAAFIRREKVLEDLAALKGSAISLHMMFRCWELEATGKYAARFVGVLEKLLNDIEWYLRTERRNVRTGNEVFDSFGRLADLIADFAPAAGFLKGGEGGMNRMSQYLRTMMQNFECVRAVRDSQTPVGLRLFCFALIHMAPIILSPYWNHFCDKMVAGHAQTVWGEKIELKGQYGCQASYFMAIAYVLIVITLYRVQVELEDPFDGKGDDDIKWRNWRAELDMLDCYGEDGPEKRRNRARAARKAHEH